MKNSSIARALAVGAAFCLVPFETHLADWRIAERHYDWSFPRDHWSHEEYKNEWWYFTGHLRRSDRPGERYGFQFTLFRLSLLPQVPSLDSDWATNGVILGHAALTDLQTGRHYFSETLQRRVRFLAGTGEYPDPRLAWCRGPAGTASLWQLFYRQDAFQFNMHDTNRDFGFTLRCEPSKPVVLQGQSGYSAKTADGASASLYYSFTRLRTEGIVFLAGESFEVTGQAWMDKEFSSNQLAENQAGWDWFSLQLEDGRELMLYALRQQTGEVDHKEGTLVDANGEKTDLAARWSTEAQDTWRSPHSGARYPNSWRLRVPEADLELTIEALVDDAENYAERSPYYWEGPVRIQDPAGNAIGVGYAELTGYGDANRPPL